MSDSREDIKIIEFSARVLTTDFLLRWASLGIYRLLFKESFEVGPIALFFLVQLLIFAFSTGYAFYRKYLYDAYRENKIPDNSLPGIIQSARLTFSERKKNYEIIGTSSSIILRIIYVFAVAYMILNVVVRDPSLSGYSGQISGFVISLAVFVYGGFVYTISYLCVPDPDKKLRKFISDELLRNPQEYLRRILPQPENLSADKPDDFFEGNPIDINDRQILEIEGEIKNLMNRVEAYILESVMFGALAFSGFLTIIAADTDKIDYETMRVFGYHITSFISDFVVFEIKNIEQYKIFSTHPDNLMIMVMFETLICAMSFILVIAARLRFSHLAEKIDMVISLARSYNNKEEEAFNMRLQSAQFAEVNDVQEKILEQRLFYLTKKINHQVKQAEKLVFEVDPIVQYMGFFRNLGVVTFLIVIITSLFLFSKAVAGFFAGVAVLAYLFKQFDTWFREKRAERILKSRYDENS